MSMLCIQIKALVILGDRPLNITLKRLWLGLTLFQKISLVFQLLVCGITLPTAAELREMMEKLRKKTDLLTEAVQELGQKFPWIVESLIDERDMYMVMGLREVRKSMKRER